jgi:putative ABC transport system permease protein
MNLFLLLHVRRNIARNSGRTFGILLVVGLTIGIFLVLGQVNSSIVTETNQVVAAVPNIVTVQTAGGYVGGGNYLNTGGTSGIASNLVSDINNTTNVVATQRIFDHPISSGSSSSCFLGTMVWGEDTTSPIKLILGGLSGATSPTITSGRNLEPSDENSFNAIVGQQYASQNDLNVGSQTNINGQTFNVVGIFSGSGCNGLTIIVPYPTAATAMGIGGPSILYVVVNQYKNVNGVVSSLESELGSSYTVENLANADHSALQSAISSVLFSSQFGEYASLITGAAVMVVVMILVTSRRTKEIGLLKTLGYSGGRILGQVLLESLIVALLGLPLALLVSFIGGPAIAQSMLSQVGNASPSNASALGSGNFSKSASSLANPFFQNLSFSVTPETIALAITITVAFGLIGAFYPSMKALLLRPTEALRRE